VKNLGGLSLKQIKQDKYLWLTLLAGLAIIFVVMLPRFFDPYSTEDDFLNWHWMHRFTEPDLFPNDTVAKSSVYELTIGSSTLMIHKTSPLYGLLFQLLTPFISLILLGKLLVFPLITIAIYYLYRISERLTSPPVAAAICLSFVLLNIVLTSLVSVVGGFQRSFALPLLLAFIYYWWQGHYGRSLFVLFLAGGIYPPLFVLLAITAVFKLLLSWWSDRHKPASHRYAIYLLGIVLVGLMVIGLLWPIVESRVVAAFANDVATGVSLADDSRFGPYGRLNLFNIYPVVGRGGIADHGTTSILIMVFALLAVPIVTWQPQRLYEFPRIFKTLFWASWFAFLLAWVTFLLTQTFVIYLPSRYTQASVLLILFVFVAVNGPAATRSAARWIMFNTAVWFWFNLLLGSLIILMVLIWPQPAEDVVTLGRGLSRWLLFSLATLLIVLAVLIRQRPRAEPVQTDRKEIGGYQKKLGIGLLVLVGMIFIWLVRPFMDYTYFTASSAQRAMYAYIQTLPKDMLLAGSPDVNSIPMFGQRSVLYNYGRLGPTLATVVDAVTAYYASEPAPILAFCQQYGVDYLIINQYDFVRARQPDGRYFYEPYHSMAVSQIGPPQTTAFFLETLPASAKSFQQDEWSIAPCTPERLGQ
jgi:hypothetical protein